MLLLAQSTGDSLETRPKPKPKANKSSKSQLKTKKRKRKKKSYYWIVAKQKRRIRPLNKPAFPSGSVSNNSQATYLGTLENYQLPKHRQRQTMSYNSLKKSLISVADKIN
jgi:hypothetical protein